MSKFWTQYLQHNKHNMITADTLLGLIAPHICIGCGQEGSLLCEDCIQQFYQPPAPRCAGCFALSENFKVCNRCKKWLPLKQVFFTGTYEGVNESLVEMCKFEYKRQAIEPMASMLSSLIDKQQMEEYILCPIPTAPARVRLRGFDHTKLLSKKVSINTSIESQNFLKRHTNNRQIGADRQKRIQQMEAEFYTELDLKGKNILLIDDVMTTGATIAAAAKSLKKAGAKNVNALVFARKT